MLNTKENGLTYVNLDLNTCRIVLLSDASFANNVDLKSQLGYLILLVDGSNKCNILHYGSNRCKRVCRSVMAAELHALTLGFDYAIIIREMLNEILGRMLKIEAMIDSKTVFNVIAKDSQTTERRLQIDALGIRQSYNTVELSKLSWIPGTLNLADPLTKPMLNKMTPLYNAMMKN